MMPEIKKEEVKETLLRAFEVAKKWLEDLCPDIAKELVKIGEKDAAKHVIQESGFMDYELDTAMAQFQMESGDIEEADATLAKLCQENQKMQKRLDSSKPGDFPAEWFSAQYGHLEKSRRETGKIQLQLVQKKLKSRDLQGPKRQQASFRTECKESQLSYISFQLFP